MGSSDQLFERQCNRCFANFTDAEAFAHHMAVHIVLPNRPPPASSPPQAEADAGLLSELTKEPDQRVTQTSPKRKRTAKALTNLPYLIDGTSTYSSAADEKTVTPQTSRGAGSKRAKLIRPSPSSKSKTDAEQPATSIPVSQRVWYAYYSHGQM